MRRVLILFLVLACGAGAIVAAGAGDGGGGSKFTVELDNAFGLVEGGDLKIAGVRAGTVTGMRIDPKGKRALVDFEVTREGFGSLRKDVFCESRPQSLIGEYFIDCEPGKSSEELKEGATIPVEQTASTIPTDLLNNVLRRPYRERLRIILHELGTGVGGRAEDLNEAIRRFSPALRETNKTLALLARQNRTLVSLTENADEVVGDLAGNRKDVGRFVVEARDTARASAERRDELAAGFRKLPGFLRELRPTMAELGRVADSQGPALADLSDSAGELERLFDNLGPFSEATRVNVRSLAETSKVGRPAVKAAQPTAAQLNRVAEKAPELGRNLAIILEHLDDPKYAVEKDPRSPGGNGYTGLQALLQYFFDQPMAINIFDDNGYILKVNAFEDECSAYQNAESLKQQEKESPGFIARCNAYVGPNQPGITSPDPTRSKQAPQARRAGGGDDRDGGRDDAGRDEDGGTDGGGGGGRDGGDGGAPRGDGGGGGGAPQAQEPLRDLLDDLLEGDAPKLPDAPKVPGTDRVPDPAVPGSTRDAMLDFLFGG